MAVAEQSADGGSVPDGVDPWVAERIAELQRELEHEREARREAEAEREELREKGERRDRVIGHLVHELEHEREARREAEAEHEELREEHEELRARVDDFEDDVDEVREDQRGTRKRLAEVRLEQSDQRDRVDRNEARSLANSAQVRDHAVDIDTVKKNISGAFSQLMTVKNALVHESMIDEGESSTDVLERWAEHVPLGAQVKELVDRDDKTIGERIEQVKREMVNRDTQIQRRLSGVEEHLEHRDGVSPSELLGDFDDLISTIVKHGPGVLQNPSDNRRRAGILLENLEEWGTKMNDDFGGRIGIDSSTARQRLGDTLGMDVDCNTIRRIFNYVATEFAADSNRSVRTTKTESGKNKLLVQVSA